ncbi:MAG: hypothetical protein HY791_05470 [Deltaproteobacteria bacterium]|nr:hypothetical protein [Deltaproteobacteria bacterium]
MSLRTAPRDQIVSRVATQVVKEAVAASGKGGVLSKAEQEKLKQSNLLRDAAQELRWAAGKGAVVRLDPWVDAAMAKVTGAVESVDKPGRGHGTISRAEARTAVATKGDAGARIGRAYEVLTGTTLESKGAVSPKLQQAVQELVENQKFSVLSVLRGSEPTAWVQSKIEGTLEKWGGDGLMASGRIKVGSETVHVGTATTWAGSKLTELVGFFDKEGRPLVRAQIERDDETFALQLRSMSLDGKPQTLIASSPGDVQAPPAEWVTGLEAELKAKYENGDDLGTRIKRAELPPTVRAAFEFAERNTPDGVGLEKMTFQGKTAYAIHDYSCVSSVAIFSEEGKKLFSFVS